jgi:hypothetical protein
MKQHRQKKYTKKNHKGGLVNKNVAEVSIAAIQKRLEKIELDLDMITNKIGAVKQVEGPSRENDTGYEEAGYSNSNNVRVMDNPMNSRSPSPIMNITEEPITPSSSSKKFNGTTQVTPGQYKSLDNEIETLKKAENNNDKQAIEMHKKLINALYDNFQKRINFLNDKSQNDVLTQDENDELNNLQTTVSQRNIYGGRKSRRYKKSKRTRRTRKYKKSH